MDMEVGRSAKGLFRTTASGGRAFTAFRRRQNRLGALDRFAEELSKHTDQEDIDAGRGTALDPGGDCRVCARRIGARAEQGNAMLQRIRKRLGWQAR